MNNFLKVLVLTTLVLFGCAAPGTVGTKASGGLLTPIIERTDAYILLAWDQLPEVTKEAYKAAKQTVTATYADERIAAATSWLSVEYICQVHDTFVNADVSLKEPHKSTYLRSTALIRRLYLEAFKAAGRAPPVGVAESQPATPFLCPDRSCKMGG